jgi:hypothetical protein
MKRQFCIYFYPVAGILYSTREKRAKKVYALPLNNPKKDVRQPPVDPDFSPLQLACFNHAIKAAANGSVSLCNSCRLHFLYCHLGRKLARLDTVFLRRLDEPSEAVVNLA